MKKIILRLSMMPLSLMTLNAVADAARTIHLSNRAPYEVTIKPVDNVNTNITHPLVHHGARLGADRKTIFMPPGSDASYRVVDQGASSQQAKFYLWTQAKYEGALTFKHRQGHEWYSAFIYIGSSTPWVSGSCGDFHGNCVSYTSSGVYDVRQRDNGNNDAYIQLK